jgi:zinc/manganese transport system substrate-binding protein
MRRSISPLPILIALSALVVAGCGTGDDGSPAADRAAGTCPTDPVNVVVSVDQWGDIASQLGGACADVTTIIKSSSIDPHDYEPTAADTAQFTDAQLVVVNGVDYDHWAQQAVDTLGARPAVVDGADVVGVRDGANPHLWYSPDDVTRIADAITAQLKRLAPAASAYLDRRNAAFGASMKPYRAEIAKVKAAATGKTYGATEGVFDSMAQAVGLRDVTPQGYHNAAANESDPAPGDVDAFESALRDGTMDVLVYNTQTEGSIPKQILDVARKASVPVVDVTETVPPSAASFEDWQISQLQSLSKAVGGAR